MTTAPEAVFGLVPEDAEKSDAKNAGGKSDAEKREEHERLTWYASLEKRALFVELCRKQPELREIVDMLSHGRCR